MLILDLFEEVKIENESRLNAEDMEFCKIQEEIYLKAYATYENFVNTIISLKDNECKTLGENKTCAVSYGFNKWNTEKVFNELNENFAHGVTGYFRNKYNVDIDVEKIKSLIGFKKSNLDTILNNIFDQLGGFNFEDKSKQEMIDKLKKHTRCRDIAVKNRKISISEFVWIDRTWGEVSYNSREELINLFTIFNHFSESGLDKKELNTIGNIRKVGVHELEFKGIESLKIYKNGKIDINFIDGATALKFANTYINYKA